MDKRRTLKTNRKRKGVIVLSTRTLAKVPPEATPPGVLPGFEPIILNAEDSRRFWETLQNPPAPNAAMRKAAARYAELVEDATR